MAEDEKKELDPLVTMPHGKEQLIKMEIVGMIHGGESPYDVISHMARWLEKQSGEAGYADYVDGQIRAVYGFALQHVKPMEDELRDVKARLLRIQEAYNNPDFSEEEHIRIGFAVDRHKKNIKRLEEMIIRAKADHKELIMEK